MADVQLENGYIRIATELMNEIIRRDFSKRQLAVLHFIIRLSYGCQRKDCLIERFNAFEIAGINKVDIKKELKFLKNCGVINWDEETMIFSMNKDYEKWQITPSKGFDQEKLDELVHQNIKRKVSKTLTDLENIVSKTLTNLGEKVSKTLTTKLVKHLLQEVGNAWESKDEEVLKDSIKDIYLKIKEEEEENPIRLFEKNFGAMTTTQMEKLWKWVDDFENQEVVCLAVKETAIRNPDYPFSWLERVLVDWHRRKLLTPDDVLKEKKKREQKVVNISSRPKEETLEERFARLEKEGRLKFGGD